MTFDLLEALEKKIVKAVDSITELQIQLDDAIEAKNKALAANETLKVENEALSTSHEQWQSRLTTLVEKMDQVDEAIEGGAEDKHAANQDKNNNHNPVKHQHNQNHNNHNHHNNQNHNKNKHNH